MNSLRRWSLAALVTVLFLSSCGGVESAANNTLPDTSDAPAAASDDTAATSASTATTRLADFEIFAIDDSAGCSVYVSAPAEQASSDESVAAAQILNAIYASDNPCSYTEPAELGLITVDELDSYGQPAWGSVEPHFYFTVADWAAVGAACEGAVDTDVCSAAVSSNFAQVQG